MERRDFIRSSALALAAAGLPQTILAGCTRKDAAGPNISFQEETAPGESLGERLDFMEENGVVGFEPGGWGLRDRVGELNSALKGRNIRISAICAGFDGFILSADPSIVESFDNSMRSIIAAAGELGSTGVIMVPAFNGQTPCRPHSAATREYLVEKLAALGEFALSCGTTVILEPLNRNEAFYLRQVGDAAAICRDTACAGVKCMGDFWHMSEEVSDYGAFMSAGAEYLQHVHIASRGHRVMPGEDGELDNYVEGFRALKQIGYDKFISFECGCDGDRRESVLNALKLIRDQWNKA